MHTQLWWRHIRWPLAAFVPLMLVLAATDLDAVLARWAFFDTEHLRWAGAGNWWVEQVLHTGGRWFIRALVAAAGAAWIATYIDASLRPLRRPAAYFVVATVLAVGCVGILKTVTNVDCPWDLAPFGGRYPFVHLFAHRTDGLHHARCFPAAHASSGYALVALYFVGRERSRMLARVGLSIGLLAGILFGLAQQSRGAHFLSHDAWSAFLVWLIVTSVYVFLFKAQLAAPVADSADVVGRIQCGAGGALRSSAH